jgi:hypothetical protein
MNDALMQHFAAQTQHFLLIQKQFASPTQLFIALTN